MKIDDFFPSKYLKSADFDGDQALTIVSVLREDFEGDKKPIVSFQETDKELVLNRTNFTTIAHLHGQDTDSWIGEQIQLFTTEVDFRGQQVLAIRVRMKAPTSGNGPRLQGSVIDTRKITPDQQRRLFRIGCEAFEEDREAARDAIKKILNHLEIEGTADLNRTDYDRICNLLEKNEMPPEWEGRLDWVITGITDDDIPF